MGKIYTIYGSDAREMTIRLMEAADVKSKIPAGASIALKPNLVVAHAPDSGATTHAGVLEGCIQYLQANGFDDICIMEGSWVGDRTSSAFRVCGYDQVGKKYDVPLYDLKHDTTETINTHFGKMEVCKSAFDIDYLINLPVLKGHCQTTMTCALKNCKGCIPDKEKRRFHSNGLHKPIAALAAALRPDLTIVDSICGDLDFEEGGKPIQTNRMMLGEDPVQIDTYGCQLMGISTKYVPYIRLAEEYGAGSMAIQPGDIIELNSPKDAPIFPTKTNTVYKLTRNVEQRAACSACFGNLVHAINRMRDEGRTYGDKIVIGQGFKGAEFIADAVGIGNCCKDCTTDCVKGCPPTGEDIMRFLMNQR